jgi:hypothetical protein
VLSVVSSVGERESKHKKFDSTLEEGPYEKKMCSDEYTIYLHHSFVKKPFFTVKNVVKMCVTFIEIVTLYLSMALC